MKRTTTKKLCGLLAATVIGVTTATAADMTKPVKVFIVMGQSNVVGMGNTKEEARRVVDKLSTTSAPQERFPAFFGPGHDWVPDHNWGGSGIVGLQEMLLAADPCGDGKIDLLPAWPKEWDVDFKLHAPQNTTVGCVYHAGKIEKLNVSPASQKKDIIKP